MTKSQFIGFSREKKETIDDMLNLFEWHNENWVLHWAWLRDNLIYNNITASYIVNVLQRLKDINEKVKYSHSDFFLFMTSRANRGFDEGQIVSAYLDCL